MTYHGQDAGLEARQVGVSSWCTTRIMPSAMATTGDWDLVCCGHDHVANIETIDNISGRTTLLVNPGTVGGIKAPATWVMGNLETMQFSIRDVALAGATRTVAGTTSMPFETCKNATHTVARMKRSGIRDFI